MIRAKMSFLSRKPGKGAGKSLVQGGAVRRLRLCLCQTHHTGEKLALRLPRSAPLGKSQLLFGPQCPHLRNKERLALCLQSAPDPTTVTVVHPHAGPCSTSLPLPKRGKETCVSCPGRARGSGLSGCAGCCRVSEYHTNPRTDREVPPPG